MTIGRMPPRVRIAPSPTGDPHVGTAYVALFNRTFARQHGGTFVLRIEDTDQTRSTRESEAAIFRALRWLGLAWDEGPDIGGPHGPYRQSERSDIYRAHTALLLQSGAAYRCFCTAERLAEMRERQKAEKQNFGYDGRCRELSREESERRADAGEACVVRLRVPSGDATRFHDLLRGEVSIQNKEIDDQVLLKSDGFPTYHLANVVDDRLMGITHVMRAEEWIPSTPKHILLYQAFGWEPPVFCHLPLLRNKDRSKISKRKNPTSLDWYLDHGYLPEAMINFLSLMGWFPKDGVEVFDPDKFTAEFRPEDINPTGPVFDLDKLLWLNGEYIRSLALEDLGRRILNFTGLTIEPARLMAILPLVRERMKTLADFKTTAGFFFGDDVPMNRELFAAAKKMTDDDRRAALTLAREVIAQEATIETASLDAALRAAADARGIKIGDFFMCLRLATTGQSATPPLLESMTIIGRDICLRRIDAALAVLV